jgi:hypothetical protein
MESPKLKTRKKRSWLWSHYIELNDLLAECNYCKAQITFKDGTNRMKGHLQKDHNLKDADQSKKQKPVYTQQENLEKALYEDFLRVRSKVHFF